MAVGKDTGKDEGKAKDKDNLVKTSGVARASRLTVAYKQLSLSQNGLNLFILEVRGAPAPTGPPGSDG